METRLDTVQMQLSLLEIAAKDRRKPWWKQTAILISIVGLTISASFSLYNAIDQLRQRDKDQAKQRTAALDATIADLVAIRMEDAKQAAALASTNQALYRAWSSTAAAKRSMLVDSAMSSINGMGVKATPSAALLLGNELIVDGRYKDAEEILLGGEEAARSAKLPLTYLQSTLAQVYLFPGSPKPNPQEGRYLYRLAIDSIPSHGD
jgi:hypothetical protein